MRPRECVMTGVDVEALLHLRQRTAGEVDDELALVGIVGMRNAGHAAGAGMRRHHAPDVDRRIGLVVLPIELVRCRRVRRRRAPASSAANRRRCCRWSRPWSGSRRAARRPRPSRRPARPRCRGGDCRRRRRPDTRRSRGRAASGRSPSASRRRTSWCARSTMLMSGRQMCSPQPVHMARPSLSWISGRQSVAYAPVVLAVPEHAGERRDADAIDIGARVEIGADVDDRHRGPSQLRSGRRR